MAMWLKAFNDNKQNKRYLNVSKLLLLIYYLLFWFLLVEITLSCLSPVSKKIFQKIYQIN